MAEIKDKIFIRPDSPMQFCVARKSITNSAEITDALAPGDEVIVIDKKQDSGQLWCKIKRHFKYDDNEKDIHFDEDREGWIMVTLLEEAGRYYR